MKNIITTFLLMIFTLVGFSQIKHNKFSTLITFDTLNPSSIFGQTGVTELKNNSGYFLTNFFDNQLGGFNPSIVKLDVDGNLVMDTIYDYVPNNTSGYSSFVDAVTSINSHTALYSTTGLQLSLGVTSPYIINFDLNGNINWNFGFSDDSLDLEPQRIINTQDGGYLIAGKMYDFMSSVDNPAGFAIKLDNMGVMQWHKLYTNRDTMNLTFKDVIELNNGDYFFVGQAENKPFGSKTLTEYDFLVSMIRTDNTGLSVWNKGFIFGTPINNEVGFMDITTGLINDSTAYVFCTVTDSSVIADYIAIASVNLNTGVQNWTNYYTLPLGQSNIGVKSLPDGKGNILVTANDNNNYTSVLYKIDGTGNVINTKRFVLGSSSNNSLSLIKTLDGGFVQVNYFTTNQVLVVKSDKNLEVSCPDIDSSYFSLTVIPSSDTSYFGIVDSSYILPNLSSQNMILGSPFNSDSKDSLICSCSNSITGTVRDGMNPAQNAKVFLFRKGIVPKPWAAIDSTLTDALGQYTFNYVATDSFLVKVTPNPILQPNAIQSYHKHLDFCFKWDSAGVFYVHCDSVNIVKDVDLINPPTLTGNSALNGYILEYTGSFSKQPGDPVPGIGITVEQSPGGVIGASSSNTAGYYDLLNLNNNSAYVISVDYPGLPNDSIWTVAINLNDSILDSLNFYIDSTGIYIVGNIGTGIESINTGDLELELFPNPSSSNFNLEVYATKAEDIVIELTNNIGSLVGSKSKSLQKGDNRILIETTDYPSGIYFLKIRQGINLYIKKLIKL